jgi:hypothetical protein
LPLTKNVGVPETPLKSAESTSAAILACPAWLRRSRVNWSMSRPSSPAYAEVRVMPTGMLDVLVRVVNGLLVSA